MNDYELIRSEISSFIGTPIDEWDTRTSSDVDSSIRRGIDSVIHNPMSHQWSFMRPTYRVQTADGQRRYTLPADFEEFIDHISFDGDNYQYPPITQLPASRLQQMYSEYANTGVPSNYSLEVPSHDGTVEQRREFVLHPTPDGSYQLIGQYQVGPIRTLTSARPWFPGGPEFRELFVAGVLAATESKFMDQQRTDKQQQFQATMLAAIGRDHRKQPRNLGKMVGGRHGRDSYRWKLQTQHEGHVDSV